MTRQAVRTAPKVLKDVTAHLSNLQDILRNVEHEPELNTSAIRAQLDIIRTIILDLKQMLVDMVGLQQKSLLQQGIHALRYRTKDETSLWDVLKRLETSKLELAIRINVVHVEITRGVAQGVEKIEREARMERLERREHQDRLDQELRLQKTVQDAREEQVKWEARKNRSEAQVRLLLEDNLSEDDSNQFNGIFGFDNTWASTWAQVMGNKVVGKSMQKNLILGGTIPPQLLSELSRI